MISSTTTYREKAREFLKIAPQFKLGMLTTETQHPKTLSLSTLAHSDLVQAIALVKEIDLDTLAVLRGKTDEVVAMAAAVKATLERGGRIFLCGCGSTGRLSLVLETLWRELQPLKSPVSGPGLRDRVISFMAGGDIALIKAVEQFEDYPEFGAQQLLELGFSAKDLLISTTEGGETPFVIGATEKAAEISHHAPYFLYCNPDKILIELVERSKRVIENDHIRKLNLTVGPMAISGSTRMQATTILMLAVGLAIIHFDQDQATITQEVEELYRYYDQLDITCLKSFIEKESDLYKNDGYVFYEADEDFAISILTDTTERAPTFSLVPFENLYDRDKPTFRPSLSYLVLPKAKDAPETWRLLLGREPRALNWKEFEGLVDLHRLYGHDFSQNILRYRREYLPAGQHSSFMIKKIDGKLLFQLDELSHRFLLDGLSRLSEHIVLKMLLNTHSTLVMGRLGRYEGNLMTYVRPSNNKLIDRTIRYVRLLLKQGQIEKSYEEVAYACFREMETINEDEPIVLKTLDRLLKSS
jgi:N-acetylmuramic acid 6-phosphate etherase